MHRIETEPQFTPNREYCAAFVNSCIASGLSVHTRNKYLDKVRYISQVVPGKDFKDWDKRDVEAVMAKLRSHAKPWTVNSYVTFFKHFWRYIFDLAGTDSAPKAVRWLSQETPVTEIRKNDLPVKNDVALMMGAARTIEHKAILAVLTAGPRPSPR